MKVNNFISKLKDAANHKTLYVMGCFGAPMNATNKARYTKNNSYNMQSTRKAMINSASSDTFGFDCVCLIKGILWGWSGDTTKNYGGASYGSNGVPDVSADEIIKKCTKVSTDFSNIQPGELVHMSGHVGIYIGNGQVIECSPKWKNCVQYSNLGNIAKYKTGNYRIWTNHGFLPYVDYSGQVQQSTQQTTTKKSNDTIAQEVIDGKWGSGDARKQKLTAAGYDYSTIQSLVNAKLSKKTTTTSTQTTSTKKSNEVIAQEVIDGKWGSGDTRKQKLTAAGYDYSTIQSIVNAKLSGKSTTTTSTKKSNETIAKEVIQGKWGTGATRKQKLEAAGYNYSTIQSLVNKMLK